MKRQERCVHNKAVIPSMGTMCDLREPNTLCKNCKSFKPKYQSYRCQRCGEPIGWLGRFIEFICFGLIKHDCVKNNI